VVIGCWRAIENLPDDEREIFGLVKIQGLTHAETARSAWHRDQNGFSGDCTRAIVVAARQIQNLEMENAGTQPTEFEANHGQ